MTIMTNNDQLIADLRRTRDILAQRGRCRKRLMDFSGRVCVIGAIYMAVEKRQIVPGQKCLSTSSRDEREHRVYVELQKQSEIGIIQVNDDPATPDQEIFNLFDKALAELGGLGE